MATISGDRYGSSTATSGADPAALALLQQLMPDADPSMLAQFAASGSSGSSGSSSKGSQKVYAGTNSKRTASPQQLRAEGLAANAKEFQKGTDRYETVDQMYGKWTSWSLGEKQAFAKQMVDLGLISAADAGNYDTVKALWMSMVDEAASYTAAGKKMTPIDVAKQYSAMAGPGGLVTNKDAGFSGTRSQTDVQFDISSPEAVRGSVNKIFQQAYGRDPAPGEIDQFVASLNQAERANPITAKTETTYQDGVATGSTTTKTGGVDATAVLQDQARKSPEYGAYQASTTYFNALVNAIASPV